MSVHTDLDKIFISRKIILEMLEYRGYDTSKYQNYLKQELQILFSSDKLHMFVNHKNQDRSLLVYYIESTGSKINQKQLKFLMNSFSEKTDNKFINENTDTVIIISLDTISDTTKDNAFLYYENSISEDVRPNPVYKGLYIQLFEINTLLFNIMNHDLVPKHTILSDKQYEDEVKKVYKINKSSQLPIISKLDPVAMFIGLRPKDVCRISRSSETAGIYNNYRYCK